MNYKLGLQESLSAKKEIANMSRGLAGRTPIVPEPAKSVKDQIECLLRRSNPYDIQNILNKGDKEALTGQFSGWNTLLSATLAGISDYLLTLAHGMHLIPDLNAASTALYDRDPVRVEA